MRNRNQAYKIRRAKHRLSKVRLWINIFETNKAYQKVFNWSKLVNRENYYSQYLHQNTGKSN